VILGVFLDQLQKMFFARHDWGLWEIDTSGRCCGVLPLITPSEKGILLSKEQGVYDSELHMYSDVENAYNRANA
jgi:hypothetical protein